MKYYQSGNTVRLIAKFKDYDGVLIDPDLVRVIFYDSKYKETGSVTLSNLNRLSLGEYYYDYTIPMSLNGFSYYEWYSEINGKVSIKRDSISSKFI